MLAWSKAAQQAWCALQNNTAAKGGGIAALKSQLTIASTNFTNNTASGDSTTGYAIYSSEGQVTLGVHNTYDPPDKAQAISRKRHL
jgi:hypothetical protein